MKASEITIGEFYVSKTGWQVREAVRGTQDGRVHWYDYALSDGEPIGDGICSYESLARWAERIATPDEITRLRIVEARQKQLDRGVEFASLVLKSIPDEMLLDDVRRRGLKLE